MPDAPESNWRWSRLLWPAVCLATAYWGYDWGYGRGYDYAIQNAPQLLEVREFRCEEQLSFEERMAQLGDPREDVCDAIFDMVGERLIQEKMDADEAEAEAVGDRDRW